VQLVICMSTFHCAFILGCLSVIQKRVLTAVQELIEGKSLAQMVEAGWQPAQKEVERIAHELLTTFSYLQQQQVWAIACT